MGCIDDVRMEKLTIKTLVSYEQIVRSFIWNQRMIYKEFNNAAECFFFN